MEEELNPNLSLTEALEKKTYTPEHVKVVESALNRFKLNLTKLELDFLKIKDVELIHIKKYWKYAAYREYMELFDGSHG